VNCEVKPFYGKGEGREGQKLGGKAPKPRRKAETWGKADKIESKARSQPRKLGKRAQNKASARSQWSTPPSGPLAGPETGEKGAKRGKS